MQDIYQVFEFNKIKESILQFSKSELSREKIINLEMLKSKEEVISSLLDLQEMTSLITRYGNMPISNSANAIKLIEMAKKTLMLTPRDLNLIALDVSTSKNVIKFIEKIKISYPRLSEKISHFIDLSSLEKEINRVITSSLTVRDDASESLKAIRKKLKKVEETLQNKITSISFVYSSYLNDGNATLRDGHLVLPVKTSEKSKVVGIVYDVSDSGATTFIEPLEIAQLNNEIASLKVEENEEIRKILKALTSLVLLQEGEIINNNEILSELDFITSKAMYSSLINGEIASICDEQKIEFINARHPLIEASKVVANSYYLNSKKKIVIISGPNAGGKTVSLKTVGLLVLMNQCGLAIPVSKANVGYFKNIFVDIGDSQSLSDNLSTFSAHMSHIAEIIDIVKGKDLVLLDELGTGTDPKEGEAIALGVTMYLEKRNPLALISSHFDALKEYAFASENIENSSMLFNKEKLSPTYRFSYGSPGHSYGLDVAKRYGINDEVIAKAKEIIENSKTSDNSILLDKLERKILENEKLKNDLDNKAKELTNKEMELIKIEKSLVVQKENLLKDVKREKEEMIKNAQDELDHIFSLLKKGDIKLNEIIDAKHKINELKENLEIETFDEDIKINDYVSIPCLQTKGKVIRISSNKVTISSISGMNIKVEKNKCHKIQEPKNDKKINVSFVSKDISESIPLQLNLIGMHVDEARNVLSNYIDNAILKKMNSVRIIHGFGSGALRKMTRDYLDSIKIKYRPGDETEGMGGVTVVLFRDK